MSKKLLLGAIVAIVPILGIAGYAAAGGGQSSLADLRQATAKYHDVATALAEPNAVELPQVPPFGTGTCIENLSGDGAMGIHILLQDRVDDRLVPTEPEAILYEKRNDGSYKLTDGILTSAFGENEECERVKEDTGTTGAACKNGAFYRLAHANFDPYGDLDAHSHVHAHHYIDPNCEPDTHRE